MLCLCVLFCLCIVFCFCDVFVCLWGCDLCTSVFVGLSICVLLCFGVCRFAGLWVCVFICLCA